MGPFNNMDGLNCKWQESGHSSLCHDLRTRWHSGRGRCIPCDTEPGSEITPNCGYDDHGGQHQSQFKECRKNTFNPGDWHCCRPCSPCPPESVVIQPCNSTTDTQCQDRSDQTTRVPVTETTSSAKVSTILQEVTNGPARHFVASASPLWAAPLITLIVILLALSAYIIYMKRKRGPRTAMEYRKRSPLISDEFPQFTAVCNYDPTYNLSSEILSAPLQTVMDNLDVLEQLVILLDPESPGVKNTKHLASNCSFSSAWITYTYSMKESKSPLKAVLEGVTSKHPDWTVGHLAKLLKQIERNDALAILTQLRRHEMSI